jgi:predicted alpha/beta-hydrolase family hydrolase
VAAIVATMLVCTVGSVSARPAPDTDNGFAPATTPPVVPHVAASGMTSSTVALIGLGSAAVAVLVTEFWHAYSDHRRVELGRQPPERPPPADASDNAAGGTFRHALMERDAWLPWVALPST